MSLITLVLYLVVAVVSARLAGKFVSSTLPGGSTTSVLIGVIGAFLGPTCIGSYGPAFEGVSLLPSVVGSVVLILATSYLGRFIHKSA